MANTVFEGTFNTPGGQPLNVTLAWTDPAGEVTYNGASVLVNNLDLRVISNDSQATVLPWKLGSSPSSNAVRADNNADNIEKVQIANASGSYTVRVSHKGTTLVNPTTGSVPSQQYSLIITGTDGVLSTIPLKQADTAFNMWPNPANSNVNISFNSAVENNASVVIYDVQGRIVKQSSLTGSENTVDIQNLTSGVYFVNVSNGVKKEVKKLVVK